MPTGPGGTRTARPYRWGAGVSRRGNVRDRWQATAVSVVLHAAVLALLVSPTLHSGFAPSPSLGAGGVGSAGGGGGKRGSFAERLRFVSVRAAPSPAATTAPPDVVRVTPDVPREAAWPVANPAQPSGPGVVAAASSGAGPGSGGGTGSGIGTGTGTSVGPGTGGGAGDIYPPTPTQFFLPPLPAPPRIRPYTLVAWFDVDERGNATLLRFTPSRDAAYNRRLREVLLSLRFRPAVRADGAPVRDTVDIQYTFR
jgi:protein TonB